MRSKITITILIIATVALAVANLFYGSVAIPADQVIKVITTGTCDKPSWQYIILESRLPQTITAMLCGASLAVSGLLLQTSFHNPLAGPSILGITNGASLGVALVMLICGGVLSLPGVGQGAEGSGLLIGNLAIITSAFLGALLIIALLIAISSFVHNNLMLLIVGIMISYLTSSVVSLCNFFANADNIQSYVMWGMGSFSDVSLSQLPLFTTCTIIGLVIAILLIKPLNLLLLGEEYATSLGVNIRNTRRLILLATGILTAVTTAFCGPIAFIGLAVPHIARLITNTSNHTVLLPTTIITGTAIALLCNIICIMPHNMIIPLNAVTPIFGAPVIIYIIFRKH